MTRREEHYEGFGAIPTFTYRLDGASAPTPEAAERLYENRGQALRTGLSVLAPLLLPFGAAIEARRAFSRNRLAWRCGAA